MKLLSGIAVAAMVFAANGAAAATAAEGLTAYTANRVAEAERLYAEAAADPATSAVDRAMARRELGRIAWLIDGDAAKATRALDASLAAGEDRCETAELYARVLREAGRAAEAAAKGHALAATCVDPAEAADLGAEIIRADLDLAAGSRGRPREKALSDARAVWAGFSEDARAGLDANRLRLGTALLAGDPEVAFEAWQGYFWLTDKDAPQAMEAWRGKVRAAFTAGLRKGASAADQSQLAALLIRAGYGPEARRFAESAGLAARAGADPAWVRSAAYFRYRDGLDAANLSYNRRMARGGRAAGAGYGDETARLVTVLMREAGLSGDPKAALAEAYGLYGTGGETSGYPSTHLGHMVVDDRRAADQYGRSGKIRFIAIDGMLSNGFESWLWDGRAAAGGWAEDGGVIIQVRPGYAAAPLRAWALLQPGPARERFDARLKTFEAQDQQALASAPVAYLPGVSARLRLQAYEQMRAKAGGGALVQRRTAFLDEAYRAVVQHSITIHEGRHALDQAAFGGADQIGAEEMEYRAKLSELALADYPRLPLASIDADTINSDTPHGRANTRIIEAYRAWIAAHTGEIAGFDPTRSGLTQLDKLSDDQIREVAKRLDPWSKGLPKT